MTLAPRTEEPCVAAALRLVARARAEERRLQDAIINGDMSVTAAQLGEAELAVRHAVLRVEAARKIITDEAEAARQRVIQRGEKLRARRAQAAHAEKVAGWQRVIDEPGAVGRMIQAFKSDNGGLAPNLDAEFLEMIKASGLLEEPAIEELVFPSKRTEAAR